MIPNGPNLSCLATPSGCVFREQVCSVPTPPESRLDAMCLKHELTGAERERIAPETFSLTRRFIVGAERNTAHVSAATGNIESCEPYTEVLVWWKQGLNESLALDGGVKERGLVVRVIVNDERLKGPHCDG